MPDSAKTILAVLDDLFFRVKIEDAAKRVALCVEFVRTPENALAGISEDTPLVILDLNSTSFDAVALATEIKRGQYAAVPVVGYVSHVQVDLKQRAQAAGCDAVVARSVFSTSLPEILRRYADSPA